MYSELNWYSKSRDKIVRISVNGGAVYYDGLSMGFEKTSDTKRLSVLKAILELDDKLEAIFKTDDKIRNGR